MAERAGHCGLEWIREKVTERGIKRPEWPDKAALFELY